MILLDTDILIDIALDRHPYAGPAAALLDQIEQGAERACIAWHTVSNFYYIVAAARGGGDARDFIVELTRFVAGSHYGHRGYPVRCGTCRWQTSRTRCRWRPLVLAARGTSSPGMSGTTCALLSVQWSPGKRSVACSERAAGGVLQGETAPYACGREYSPDLYVSRARRSPAIWCCPSSHSYRLPATIP